VDRPLTVTWFVPVGHRDYDRMPASVWIRCLQLHPFLERLGVRCLINDRRARADVAVLVRMQDGRALELARELRAAGTRVIFDLCVDYLDVTGLLGEGYGVTERHRQECLAMLDVVDAVTTASAFIAGRVVEHHPRVVYIPDSIDRQHFRHTKTYPEPSGAPPTAIWCGVAVKAPDLEPILPMLRARKIPLVVVADRRPRLSAPFEFVRWRHATAPHDLLRADVCVAPRLLDTSYNLGHSFFKIGIFLTQGVPAVASPVPSYAEVLRAEQTGLVCTSPEEWEAALDRLLADPQILARWSPAAVEAMRPYWSENLAPEYRRLFLELADGRA
jgi:glycosyltransferase involved in cell wall biosynthesis